MHLVLKEVIALLGIDSSPGHKVELFTSAFFGQASRIDVVIIVNFQFSILKFDMAHTIIWQLNSDITPVEIKISIAY